MIIKMSEKEYIKNLELERSRLLIKLGYLVRNSDQFTIVDILPDTSAKQTGRIYMKYLKKFKKYSKRINQINKELDYFKQEKQGE